MLTQKKGDFFDLRLLFSVYAYDSAINTIRLCYWQHFLYFLPLPQGQGSFLPIFWKGWFG